MSILLPALAAFLLILLIFLVLFLYVKLQTFWLLEQTRIEQVQVQAGEVPVRWVHQVQQLIEGLISDSEESPDPQVDLGDLAEADLIRALAAIKDERGRQRYSRTRLAGLLHGTKTDQWAELNRILDDEDS